MIHLQMKYQRIVALENIGSLCDQNQEVYTINQL